MPPAMQAASGYLLVDISGLSQKYPSQSKKFLSSGWSNTAFITLLVAEWTGNATVYAPRLHHLHETSGTLCTAMTSFDGVIPFLMQWHRSWSTLMQEEADMRLTLLAGHATLTEYSNIVIWSPDTDVTVLAYCYSRQIQARQCFFILAPMFTCATSTLMPQQKKHAWSSGGSKGGKGGLAEPPFWKAAIWFSV